MRSDYIKFLVDNKAKAGSALFTLQVLVGFGQKQRSFLFFHSIFQPTVQLHTHFKSCEFQAVLGESSLISFGLTRGPAWIEKAGDETHGLLHIYQYCSHQSAIR